MVLVDVEGRAIGRCFKLAAHRSGLLHRAFSSFLFNARGETLLQRRALGKYHSGGLWSNSCCGHPRPGEDTRAAAKRRLREELGIDTSLEEAFQFVYRAALDGGLVEHEFDHVFLGRFEGSPEPDPREVAEWRWAAPGALESELARSPDRFSHWFRLALPRVLKSLSPR